MQRHSWTSDLMQVISKGSNTKIDDARLYKDSANLEVERNVECNLIVVV